MKGQQLGRVLLLAAITSIGISGRGDAGEVSFFTVDYLRQCDAGTLPADCRVLRDAFIKGVAQGMVTIEMQQMVRDAPRAGLVPSIKSVSKCLEKFASFDQLFAVYEKHVAENPEQWGALVTGTLQKAMLSVCPEQAP